MHIQILRTQKNIHIVAQFSFLFLRQSLFTLYILKTFQRIPSKLELSSHIRCPAYMSVCIVVYLRQTFCDHQYTKEGEIILPVPFFYQREEEQRRCICGHCTIKIFNEQLLLAVGLEVHLCDYLLRPPSLQ